MKNTTKNTKTVLVVAIILSLGIAVGGLNFVEVKALQDEIPSDQLLTKDDSWAQKYSDATEFEKVDNAIRAYVNDTHPDNKWNEVTKNNEIKIYNFDVMTETKNAGLHAILADAKNQKDNGTYNPTYAEYKFHEWASKKITTPIMPEASANIISQIIEAYNVNINHGHVPFELLGTDVDFWSQVMINKTCELYIECDPDEISNNIDGPDCSIVQCADAYHQSSSHILSITVDPYSCYEGTGCLYSDIESGTGTLQAHAGGQKHSNTPKLKYTVTLIANSQDDVYLAATGTLGVGSATEAISPVGGMNSVYTYQQEYVNGAQCGSEHCGTYWLTVTSNSYIQH